MTQDDRMETITDPAEIRATDEPDPFRRNPVHRTGPDDPWRFTRFVADDHECVIVRDEYDEPAPFGSCSTHRRALSSPVALGCATPAPVGAAVALDLDVLHETICDKFTGMAEVRQAADLLVAEVRSLRAKVAALQVAVSHSAESCADGPCEFHETVARAESAEAKVAAVEAKRDEFADLLARALPAVAALARVEALGDSNPDHADTCGSMLTPGAGYPCSCWQADIRAALATTGEGQ